MCHFMGGHRASSTVRADFAAFVPVCRTFVHTCFLQLLLHLLHVHHCHRQYLVT